MMHVGVLYAHVRTVTGKVVLIKGSGPKPYELQYNKVRRPVSEYAQLCWALHVPRDTVPSGRHFV